MLLWNFNSWCWASLYLLSLYFLSAFRFIRFTLFKLSVFLSHITFLFIVTWNLFFYPYWISRAIRLRSIWQCLVIVKLFWVSFRGWFILFVLLQIVRTHDLLSIISKAWQMFNLFLVEFQLLKCWNFRCVTFGIAFSMLLDFCVNKLSEIPSKKIGSPLTLYLNSKVIDDIHNLLLIHMFMLLYFFFLLFCFLAFRDSRSRKSAICSRIMTFALKFILRIVLFVLVCFTLLRSQKGKNFILEFRLRFLGINGRSTFLYCLSE